MLLFEGEYQYPSDKQLPDQFIDVATNDTLQGTPFTLTKSRVAQVWSANARLDLPWKERKHLPFPFIK